MKMQSLLYTAKEAEERIKAFQDLIARMEKEQKKPLLQQKVVGQKTVDLVHRKLKEVRDENLGNANFSKKQDLIARRGITVYSSEDHRTLRIASKLPVVGDKISPQITSIASVMLSL